MHSKEDIAQVADLLKKLGGKIEEFIPNVKGASGTTLGKAECLAFEAYDMSKKLNDLPILIKEERIGGSMAQLAHKYALENLDSLHHKASDYYRDLGLLIDFIEFYDRNRALSQ